MLKQKQHNLIDMETLERVAPVIRNMAHPLRLRILDFLSTSGEPCTVTKIMEACEAEQAIISQQLRILKDQRVLTAKREGSFVYYTIADKSVLMLLECIRQHHTL